MTAFVILAVGLWLFALAVIFIESCQERAAAERMVALDQQAADFAEPTRAQIEADMRDAEWDQYLGPFGVTRDDVRRRWDAQTPIHDELAVERLRADLDAWGGDVA